MRKEDKNTAVETSSAKKKILIINKYKGFNYNYRFPQTSDSYLEDKGWSYKVLKSISPPEGL